MSELASESSEPCSDDRGIQGMSELASESSEPCSDEPVTQRMSELASESSEPAILRARELRVTLPGDLHAVDGVDLELRRGEILGVAGESGSGKTMTALTLFGLLPKLGLLPRCGSPMRAASSRRPAVVRWTP